MSVTDTVQLFRVCSAKDCLWMHYLPLVFIPFFKSFRLAVISSIRLLYGLCLRGLILRNIEPEVELVLIRNKPTDLMIVALFIFDRKNSLLKWSMIELHKQKRQCNPKRTAKNAATRLYWVWFYDNSKSQILKC